MRRAEHRAACRSRALLYEESENDVGPSRVGQRQARSTRRACCRASASRRRGDGGVPPGRGGGSWLRRFRLGRPEAGVVRLGAPTAARVQVSYLPLVYCQEVVLAERKRPCERPMRRAALKKGASYRRTM